MVRARLNTLISGHPECDAYGRLELLLRERAWELPIEHALSLGCGFGNLERDLARRGMVRSIDAYDIAEGAIAEARKLAAEAGLDGISYYVADLDQMRFQPGTVDVVFAHQSVHHVERLEGLYETVRNALRPGGVFHLHEFVGPSRFQWSDTQLGLVNAFLDSLPPRLRRLPSGEPKPALRRPTIAEMMAADPSEAVRSADIVSALLPFFNVIEERRIGGTLLHLALGEIAQNFDPESAEDSTRLEAFFALEDRAMAEGAIGSDFVILTAIPKHGSQAAHTKPVSNGSPVPQSKVTSLALNFPPVKRLYAAVRSRPNRHACPRS
jgi:SAM-dependent methyltransferase